MNELARILIANRGEIARRIIRTCRRVGIETVAVFSDADRDAPFVREADDAVWLPGLASAETYLRIDLLIAAALDRGCDGVHPGYGFLSERADFARAVTDAGLVWIGPPATAIESMGSKTQAKRLMRAAGVPVLPDSTEDSMEEIGLPALVKAAFGGGGRGMRVVRDAAELDDALAGATREALAAFGDGEVFVERYVEHGRHIEVQIFADSHGTVVPLFERDCTFQRRHQKILEEAPSPAVDDDLWERLSTEAVAAAQAVAYVGAGTIEFLLDPHGDFWFLEMNTRLQVEHPVTEMITGLDLVELQLLVAAGEPLPDEVLATTGKGHAIEVRLCAEDPWNGYRPSTGTFHTVEFPAITGTRVDSAIESGSTISPHYDSMIAKLIAHGPTRESAVRRLLALIDGTVLVGPDTNLDQLRQLLFVDPLEVDTTWVDRNPPHPRRRGGVALALAVGQAEHRARTVLTHVPPGWRNNPAVPQELRFGGTVIAYHRDRSGTVRSVAVDGVPMEDVDVAALQRSADEIRIVDGIAHWPGGVQVPVPQRFPEPDDAGRAGSLVAPMPGAVRRVLVAVGDVVVAGQPLVTIEAMKMEHQIVSPTSGTVAEVFVAEGQQLGSGQVLVRIEAIAAESS